MTGAFSGTSGQSKRGLSQLHTNPFHTDYLYFPQGVNLYLDTLAPAYGVLGNPF